ncbi:MAG: dTMP kinase [Bacteroidales bacterium]|nr:dTMP kinase [Bacteroidales bacterium]
MKFAVIEGLDGSGKSTQIKLLRNYLEENKIKYKYLHFPRAGTGVYGELVARFLRGELGNINQVNPYLVALIFAGDRDDAKEMIRKWIKEGYFVLIDRYVNSNIAFQCAKFQSQQERDQLTDWILKLEFEYNNLPVPDISLFLDVPFNFTEKQLKNQRQGKDREYLKGAVDIHEDNLDFQNIVRQVYLSLEGKEGYKILNCANKTGHILQPDEIFNKIIKSLEIHERN